MLNFLRKEEYRANHMQPGVGAEYWVMELRAVPNLMGGRYSVLAKECDTVEETESREFVIGKNFSQEAAKKIADITKLPLVYKLHVVAPFETLGSGAKDDLSFRDRKQAYIKSITAFLNGAEPKAAMRAAFPERPADPKAQPAGFSR